MVWIESHSEIVGHPKTRRLAKALRITERDAVGLLHMLWHWALKYAPDGDLSRFDDEDIALAVDWTVDDDGAPSCVIEALKATRFVDADGQIHDWDEYTGRLIERREANAERMRQTRAAREANKGNQAVREHVQSRAEHVQTPPNTRARLPTYLPNLPDQTIPTGPDQPNSTNRVRARTHDEAPAARGVVLREPITEEEISKLVAQYGDQLGGPEVVREMIEEAADHASTAHYKTDYIAARAWLRRNVERIAKRAGVAANGSTGPDVRPHIRPGETLEGLRALEKY